MNKWLLWSPRVLSILLILFLTLFSFDVFTEGSSFWEILLGFFMHNIPTLVFILVLYIGWKRPVYAGLFFIFAGLFYMGLMRNSEDQWYVAALWSLILAGPAFITGTLFLLDWKVNKRG